MHCLFKLVYHFKIKIKVLKRSHLLYSLLDRIETCSILSDSTGQILNLQYHFNDMLIWKRYTKPPLKYVFEKEKQFPLPVLVRSTASELRLGLETDFSTQPLRPQAGSLLCSPIGSQQTRTPPWLSGLYMNGREGRGGETEEINLIRKYDDFRLVNILQKKFLWLNPFPFMYFNSHSLLDFKLIEQYA